MLRVYCDCCAKELTEQGGLIFTPPAPKRNIVDKWHICVKCFARLKAVLERGL